MFLCVKMEMLAHWNLLWLECEVFPTGLLLCRMLAVYLVMHFGRFWKLEEAGQGGRIRSLGDSPCGYLVHSPYCLALLPAWHEANRLPKPYTLAAEMFCLTADPETQSQGTTDWNCLRSWAKTNLFPFKLLYQASYHSSEKGDII